MLLNFNLQVIKPESEDEQSDTNNPCFYMEHCICLTKDNSVKCKEKVVHRVPVLQFQFSAVWGSSTNKAEYL